LAQNLERFHEIVVEDSLFGKDTDGTEDLKDPKTTSARCRPDQTLVFDIGLFDE
jgi:hypothetical protein